MDPAPAPGDGQVARRAGLRSALQSQTSARSAEGDLADGEAACCACVSVRTSGMIRIDCECGVTLRAKDEHAGRHMKCPRCGRLALVPSALLETGSFKPEVIQGVPHAKPVRTRNRAMHAQRAESGFSSWERRLFLVALLGTGLVITTILVIAVWRDHYAKLAAAKLAGPFGTRVFPASGAASETQVPAPFEYTVVSKEEKKYSWFGADWSNVVVKLETTQEVANKATEGDLRQLWKHMAPTLGNHNVYVYIRTRVPGVDPWARITRVLNMSIVDGEWKAEWKFETVVNESAIDEDPFYFVDEIDHRIEYQRRWFVSLPMVNRLNEELVRRGWKVKHRSENLYVVERAGMIQPEVSVTLGPDMVDIEARDAGGNSFLDTVELVFGELGIADEVKKRLYSVIGSPKYLRVAQDKPSSWPVWSWTIGDIEVTYMRFPKKDSLSANHAQ